MYDHPGTIATPCDIVTVCPYDQAPENYYFGHALRIFKEVTGLEMRSACPK